MRRFALPVVMLSAATLACGARAATRDFAVAGFDNVDLAAAADVVVHAGAHFAVRAEGEQDGLNKLAVTVRQGTLTIGWRPGERNIHLREKLRISVVMPRLAGAALSGAGNLDIDRVNGPTFTGTVGGAGRMRIAALHADAVTLAVGGAGGIAASGTTGRIDARVAGVGQIDTTGLVARQGHVDMSGTGQVRARVDGPVLVTLSGVGNVSIVGQPRCTIRKSGLGTVNCGA